MLRGGFEHVEQRRDEGVDPAAEVLQVDEDGVERAHRLAGRAADLAVEAEDRDAVTGSVKSGDSIILSCMSPRTPCCGPKTAEMLTPGRDERVEAVGQITGDRGGVREERDALAFQRAAQFGVGEQPVDPNSVMRRCLGKLADKQSG